MLRYAITAGEGAGTQAAMRARRWAAEGIDYVQLREKQMPAGEMVRLAERLVGAFAEHGGKTKLLVNGRTDVAAAAGADGVHLTSGPGELTAEQARRVFAAPGRAEPVVSASCHTLDDVGRAVAEGVGLILFGPVFEKRVEGEVVMPGLELMMLQAACLVAGIIPVFALGGVTGDNAAACLEAGAAGVAGIRLFAQPGQRSVLAELL
jgi:thiamine-phosphate pyrophosphorylase